jgi:hypothetical protein
MTKRIQTACDRKKLLRGKTHEINDASKSQQVLQITNDKNGARRAKQRLRRIFGIDSIGLWDK